MLDQAIVLAGGLGTRLGKIARSTPKPMLPVGNRPFLEYVVWNLKRFGFRRFIFSVGYLADQIVAHFGDGSRFGVSIAYVTQQAPAGTGGALFIAKDFLDEMFLVTNGDTLFDINYLDLALALSDQQALAALALRPVNDISRYGGVQLENGHVTVLCEKGGQGQGLINGGVYVMRRPALEKLLPAPCSLEYDLFPELAASHTLAGRTYNSFFIDIGVPESLQEANSLVPNWSKKPAVFFDRDGVLNIDYGHVHRQEDFCWTEGAPEGIKWLNDHGYLVIVVTNQAGIARGLYAEDEFLSFSNWINDRLRSLGAHIDATYYCPHHPHEGNGSYRRRCLCRKPESGLLQKAIQEWNIDVENSILIGDKQSDLIAAQKVGIKGFSFPGGNLDNFIKSCL
jgi:D-glycero-D-manno-heptose 1,7-bisphosphate phosphatase